MSPRHRYPAKQLVRWYCPFSNHQTDYTNNRTMRGPWGDHFTKLHDMSTWLHSVLNLTFGCFTLSTVLTSSVAMWKYMECKTVRILNSPKNASLPNANASWDTASANIRSLRRPHRRNNNVIHYKNWTGILINQASMQCAVYKKDMLLLCAANASTKVIS